MIGLAVLSGFIYKSTSYRLGLDIQGGIRLTYLVKATDKAGKPITGQQFQEVRKTLIGVLENRVTGPMSVAEASVIAKGENEVAIEIPGFADPNEARRILSTTAVLRVYWAKNVKTPKASYRPYDLGAKSEDPNNPNVDFVDSQGKPLSASEPKEKDEPDDAYSAYRAYRSLPLSERTVDKAYTKLTKAAGTAPAGWNEWKTKYKWDERAASYDGYQRMIEGWEILLEGADLAKAEPQIQGSNVQPSFKFQGEGSKRLADWCRQHQYDSDNLAFVLDGQVLSFAPLQEGAVLDGAGYIQGTFTQQYVNTLCGLLNGGALPATLEETSSQSLDPTIGKVALDQMLKAGMIAVGVIVLFMLAYYAFPGFVALIALGLYILFNLAVLKLLGATFSLAAIAGFILSIGMAVDANILVFERTKEEMREGRSLLTAVELGFKRAFPSILDSNVCTIITSIVLYEYGTGPVKGFATTLIIGVAISLFTAVTVTRSLLIFSVTSGIATNPKVFALERQWFGKELGHVMERSKTWFAISIATMIPGIIFLFMGGLKPNVEFQGGYEATYKVPASSTMTPSDVSNKLEAGGFKGSNVKFSTVAGEKLAIVTVPLDKKLEKGSEYAKIAEATGGLEKLVTPQLNIVGPQIQAETVQNAVKSVVISSVLIILYLAFRFGSSVGGFASGLKFGASAIGALLHDIIVVVGIAAIVGHFLGWEISSLSITAMLTMIGFSVHDTVVIFDRVRENLRRPHQGEEFGHLCNRSVTQSFARSLNTSGTVIVTLLVLVFFGTPTVDLKFFCVAMLTGIISGTYSSIFNATPILYMWDKVTVKKHGEEKGLMGLATAEMNRLRALAAQTSVGAPQVSAPVAGPGGPVAGDGAPERRYGKTKRVDPIKASQRNIDDEE